MLECEQCGQWQQLLSLFEEMHTTGVILIVPVVGTPVRTHAAAASPQHRRSIARSLAAATSPYRRRSIARSLAAASHAST